MDRKSINTVIGVSLRLEYNASRNTFSLKRIDSGQIVATIGELYDAEGNYFADEAGGIIAGQTA